MASIRIDAFLGVNTVKDPKRGPFWSSLKAANADVQGLAIDPRPLIDIANSAPNSGVPAVPCIYEISAGVFLEWAQSGVDVAASPLADNSSKRVYYTGDGIPKVTNLSMATAGGAPYPALSFCLGIPVPPKIRTIQSAGGSPAENRAYTYTFVSPWGEEGPPADPIQVVSATGATVYLSNMGVTTRKWSSAPAAPIGITADVTFIGSPTPGFMRITLTDAGYQNDIRVGDRISYECVQPGPAGNGRHQPFIASRVSNSGNGYIDVAANCWNAAGSAPTLWRALPVNTYNVLGAVKDTPLANQVTVLVDTTEGLRVGEKVDIEGVSGMTDLTGIFAVTALGTDPQAPSFVVALATAQTYSGAGVATRVAKHNTAEVQVYNVTFAAGVATLTLGSTANIEVGEEVLILGVIGAYQVNGKRRVASIPNSITITVPIAAMSSYVSGGAVILNSPNAFEEFTVVGVTDNGGGPYPAPYERLITLSKAHSLVAGDLVLGQDIGGAVELNTVMVVDAVVALSTGVQVSLAQGTTAYTSGGKLIKIGAQYRKRIYRTATGQTQAEFQFVDEIPGDRTRYVDTIGATGLGDVLQSDEWIQPPVDLHSLASHPSGFLVGISKNVLCATPAYTPHAWPLSLQRALPGTGVGLAVHGSSVVVCTTTFPVEFTAQTPDAMAPNKIDKGAPCVSKASIVNTGDGVAYRGPHGVHLVGFGQTANVTEEYLRDTLAPFNLVAAGAIAAYWKNKIVLLASGGMDGYVIEPDKGDRGITEISTYPHAAWGLHVSPVDGRLWLSYDGNVFPPSTRRAPFLGASSTRTKFTYWSQVIYLPKPLCFGALQVDFYWRALAATLKDREALIVRNMRRGTRSGVVGGPDVGALEVAGDEFEALYTPAASPDAFPAEDFLRVRVIANPDSTWTPADGTDDQTVVFDDYIVNDKPVRIDNGIKADAWQIQLEGTIRVSAVTLAETIKELEGS